MREKEIKKLANDLEEPRAVRLLAEWLAIEHDKTRLQGDEYMEAAQELYDYLLTIGFRLLPLLREEIKKELLTEKEIMGVRGDMGGMFRREFDLVEAGGKAQLQKIIKKLEEK